MNGRHRAFAHAVGGDIDRDMMEHPDPIVGSALTVESAQAVRRVVEREVDDR